MIETTIYVSDGRDGTIGRKLRIDGDSIEFVGDSCHLPAQPVNTRSLWVEWEGVPFFKRIRLRSPVYLKPLPGCGCSVRLKRWWRRIIESLLRRRAAGTN